MKYPEEIFRRFRDNVQFCIASNSNFHVCSASLSETDRSMHVSNDQRMKRC